MTTKTERFLLVLTPEQLEWIKKAAQEAGISANEYIRRLIEREIIAK